MAATLTRAGETAEPALASSVVEVEVAEVEELVEVEVEVVPVTVVETLVRVEVEATEAEAKTWAKTRAMMAKKKESFMLILAVFGNPALMGHSFYRAGAFVYVRSKKFPIWTTLQKIDLTNYV